MATETYPEWWEVHSDYLTPTEYPNHFKTSYYIEIYELTYYGYSTAYDVTTGKVINLDSFRYLYTITSDLLSGSVERSRDSDYTGSCNLEIVINEGSIFDPKYGRSGGSYIFNGGNYKDNAIVLKGFRWEDKVIRIVKTYDFLNDRNKEYYFNNFTNTTNDDYINDNNHKLSSLEMGWYIVDSSTTTYDDSTRTLSLSGTDLITILSDSHGGSLESQFALGVAGYHPEYYPEGLTIETGAYTPIAIESLLKEFSPLRFNNVWFDLPSGMYLIPYDLEYDSDTTVFNVLSDIKDMCGNTMLYVGTNKDLYIYQIPVLWYNYTGTHSFSTHILSRNVSSLVISETSNVNYEGIHNTYTVYGKADDNGFQPSANYSLGYGAYFDDDENITQIYAVLNKWGTDPFDAIRIGTRRTVISDDNLRTEKECWNKGKWECWKNTQFRETTTIVLCDSCFPTFIESDNFHNFGIGRRIEYTSVQTGETNCYLIDKVSHNFTDGTWTIEMEMYRPMQSAQVYESEEYLLSEKLDDHQIPTPIVDLTIGDEGKVHFVLNCSSIISCQKSISTKNYAGVTLKYDGQVNFYTQDGSSPYEYFTINGNKYGSSTDESITVAARKGDVISINGNGSNVVYCQYPDDEPAKVSVKYVLFKIYINGKFVGESCTEDENGNKIFDYQFQNNGNYIIDIQGYSAQFPPSEVIEKDITIDNITTSYLTDSNYNKLTNEVYVPIIT